MQKYVDNLFYIFENNHFDKNNSNEYLSVNVNKILAFEEWINSLEDDDIASYLSIDVEKVSDLRDFVNKGITIWLGGK